MILAANHHLRRGQRRRVVAKKDLVGTVQVPLQNRRLGIAEGLPLASVPGKKLAALDEIHGGNDRPAGGLDVEIRLRAAAPRWG